MRFRERGDGLDAMIRDLERLTESLDPVKVRARLDPITAELTEELRATMPVRTGALKASGRWDSIATQDTYEGTVKFGGAPAPYGAYVVGRGVDGVQPWDVVLPRYEDRFEEAIDDIWRTAMER